MLRGSSPAAGRIEVPTAEYLGTLNRNSRTARTALQPERRAVEKRHTRPNKFCGLTCGRTLCGEVPVRSVV
jgi:hypothetical protein